jgi:hypothetical protein
MDEMVMKKILTAVVKMGKGQIFTGSSDSDLGIKFAF